MVIFALSKKSNNNIDNLLVLYQQFQLKNTRKVCIKYFPCYKPIDLLY